MVSRKNLASLALLSVISPSLSSYGMVLKAEDHRNTGIHLTYSNQRQGEVPVLGISTISHPFETLSPDPRPFDGYEVPMRSASSSSGGRGVSNGSGTSGSLPAHQNGDQSSLYIPMGASFSSSSGGRGVSNGSGTSGSLPAHQNGDQSSLYIPMGASFSSSSGGRGVSNGSGTSGSLPAHQNGDQSSAYGDPGSVYIDVLDESSQDDHVYTDPDPDDSHVYNEVSEGGVLAGAVPKRGLSKAGRCEKVPPASAIILVSGSTLVIGTCICLLTTYFPLRSIAEISSAPLKNLTLEPVLPGVRAVGTSDVYPGIFDAKGVMIEAAAVASSAPLHNLTLGSVPCGVKAVKTSGLSSEIFDAKGVMTEEARPAFLDFYFSGFGMATGHDCSLEFTPGQFLEELLARGNFNGSRSDLYVYLQIPSAKTCSEKVKRMLEDPRGAFIREVDSFFNHRLFGGCRNIPEEYEKILDKCESNTLGGDEASRIKFLTDDAFSKVRPPIQQYILFESTEEEPSSSQDPRGPAFVGKRRRKAGLKKRELVDSRGGGHMLGPSDVTELLWLVSLLSRVGPTASSAFPVVASSVLSTRGIPAVLFPGYWPKSRPSLMDMRLENKSNRHTKGGEKSKKQVWSKKGVKNFKKGGR